MTSQGSPWFSIVFGVFLLMSVMYAAGRLHQWYRQALERDEAFRNGYDRATHSLFTLATRIGGRKAAPAPQSDQEVVRPIESAPSAQQARHRKEDRLAATKVLKRNEAGKWSA